jgi:hypothetical protein
MGSSRSSSSSSGSSSGGSSGAGPVACSTFNQQGSPCGFSGECQQTSPGGCQAVCFCLQGLASCGYLDSPQCTAELCPASPPLVGSDAAEPPMVFDQLGPARTGGRLDCTYGTADCPQRCYAQYTSTSPTLWSWQCAVPAGPTCAPSACPAALPTGQACTDWSGFCSWAGDLGCRYECVACTAGTFDPQMSCLPRSCACPATAPPPTEACPAPPYRAACSYPTTVGSGSVACDCGIGFNTQWNCHDPGLLCPPSLPSGSCTPGVDATDCSFNVPPYCGRCGCQANGMWACTASTCDQCPVAKPTHLSPCTADAIGQICQYGDTIQGPSCACVGPSPTWSCSDG